MLCFVEFWNEQHKNNGETGKMTAFADISQSAGRLPQSTFESKAIVILSKQTAIRPGYGQVATGTGCDRDRLCQQSYRMQNFGMWRQTAC